MSVGQFIGFRYLEMGRYGKSARTTVVLHINIDSVTSFPQTVDGRFTLLIGHYIYPISQLVPPRYHVLLRVTRYYLTYTGTDTDICTYTIHILYTFSFQWFVIRDDEDDMGILLRI